MIKKNYMQPTIQVVKIQTAGMLALSDIDITGLDEDILEFEESGGDQIDAW